MKDVKRTKRLYYSGNLRGIVIDLPEDHESYSEDTFELLGDFWFSGGSGPLPIPADATEENKRVINMLPRENGKLMYRNNIIEFRFGTYEVSPIWDRKIKENKTSIDLSKYTVV